MGSVALDESLAARSAALGRILQLDRDIYVWELNLADKPESQQLSEARRHLGWAVYSASIGLYSLAYGSLRVMLELSFAAVYFSANELHRRRWLADRADFSWTKALSQDEGVLSAAFVREFNERAAAEAGPYAEKALEHYRRCSQFMHGKFVATTRVPASLSYSDSALTEWSDTAQESAVVVLFLLYCRYGKELLSRGDRERLGATLEQTFAHLRSVRSDLGLPVEDEGEQ